jgi:serine protease DegQ
MRRGFIGLLGLALLTPVLADNAKKDKGKRPVAAAIQVPFSLTETKHVVVRAKINGKGPYNFIVDTGAPALFVSTPVCKKLNIEPDKDGWGTFDKFEVEGGVVLEKAKGKVADPFQLEGMNRMGLAGMQLHGVIGYTVLARFRIELDFTRDKMAWTPLKFDPGLPEGLEGKAPGGVEAMAGMAKVMSMLMGKRAEREIKPRGFLGVELASKDSAVTIAAVLKDSPAAEAGLQTGDRITQFQGQDVKNEADLLHRAGAVAVGDSVRLTVIRGSDSHQITVKAGKGL